MLGGAFLLGRQANIMKINEQIDDHENFLQRLLETTKMVVEQPPAWYSSTVEKPKQISYILG